MKYPKYIENPHMCIVKLYCHETNRWSLLPTCGVTRTSDNTCWWEDFKPYCRRVGLSRERIEEMSRGENVAPFEPMGEGGFAPIGVTNPPNAPQRYRPMWHDWYTPTMWITDEKYEEEEA